MLIPQWYPMSFTKIGHYSLVHVGLWDFFNCRYWPRLPGSELLFCIPDRYCNYKMPIAYVCSCSFFRKQVATVWDIFSHFFRGGESMWVVFFRDSETWKFEVLEVVRQLYTKKTSGVPSVSTGNRKTPSRSLSQKNLTYTKLLDEAWHCLAVCMSTCRMETKTVDALYLVWFKQCDLYDLENEHQCGATYFYYTSKEQETEELEKSQQKNALRFNGMWNQPPPKKNVFFSTFQTFVYRENGYPFFICITEHSPVSKKKKKKLSRQLRRAPPTARRPSTPTRWPRRARLPRLPPSWKLKKCGRELLPCRLAVSSHVFVCFVRVQTLKGRKVDANKSECGTSKIQGTFSIRQNPPTPKIVVL